MLFDSFTFRMLVKQYCCSNRVWSECTQTSVWFFIDLVSCAVPSPFSTDSRQRIELIAELRARRAEPALMWLVGRVVRIESAAAGASDELEGRSQACTHLCARCEICRGTSVRFNGHSCIMPASIRPAGLRPRGRMRNFSRVVALSCVFQGEEETRRSSSRTCWWFEND